MKILITGAKGQLATQLINMIKRGKSEIGEIPPLYKNAIIKGTDVDELDIANFDQVRKLFSGFKPDIVINCGAYTNVDACEVNEDLAYKVNAIGPRNLAIASEELRIKLIHISTDYVFEGDGSVPYREYDKTNPTSIYGKTKLMGENFIRECCSRHFIIRTAWLYGYNGNNFVKTIIKAAKDKGHLTVVNDQRGNPTNAEDLSHHVLRIALTDEYGIYHCTGNGECSWYDFACKIVGYAGIDCKIEPVTSEQYKRVAKRPTFSSLDNAMLRCTVGDEMRNWEEALKEFVDNYYILNLKIK